MAVLMQAKISRAAGTKMSSETRHSQAGGSLKVHLEVERYLLLQGPITMLSSSLVQPVSPS